MGRMGYYRPRSRVYNALYHEWILSNPLESVNRISKFFQRVHYNPLCIVLILSLERRSRTLSQKNYGLRYGRASGPRVEFWRTRREVCFFAFPLARSNICSSKRGQFRVSLYRECLREIVYPTSEDYFVSRRE